MQTKRKLKLTNDLVFKAFFKSNEPLLRTALKTFLPLSEEIEGVVILNPNDEVTSDTAASKPKKATLNDTVITDNPNSKSVVLDLNVKFGSGENINVEMQSGFQKRLLDRVLLYWAKLHGQNLKRGEDYDKINPTYSLIFTDFFVFNKEKVPNYMNEITLHLNKYPKIKLDLGLNIVVVELNKLTRACRDLVDTRERWCYLLKNAHHLDPGQEAYLRENADMSKALDHLNEITQDNDLYWAALAREKYEVADALERRGLFEEGMEKGIEKGKAEGMTEGRHQVALNMLHEGIELSVISKVTDLSEAEIKQLKR